MTRRRGWLTALLLALCAANVAAVESILSFDSEVSIGADGALEVTERIVVRAEGVNIRRGIYRDLPTRYRDRHGQRFTVDLQVLSLSRDGQPEPFFTESLNNGVRINFGGDALLEVPAEHAYVLRYRTTRQIGFFDMHDELYWNATGHGWSLPILRASARIVLPHPVAADQLRTDAYSGVIGSRDDATRVEREPAGARWEHPGTLEPGSGMTVVLGFPKGIVAEPDRVQQLRWRLRDSAWPIFTVACFLFLLGGYLTLWLKLGRDPPVGTIIVRYDPPAGHSPAGLRYMRRMGYDPTCLSVDTVALGVAGCLRIIGEKRLADEAWSLERLSTAPSAELPSSQQKLLDALFSDGKSMISLDSADAKRLRAARVAHELELDAVYQPRYFRSNQKWTLIGICFTVFVSFFTLASASQDIFAAKVVIAGGVLMTLTCIIFAYLLPQLTAQGRVLLDEIAGLRLYLGVAERDELSRLRLAEPTLDAGRYQKLLPYAMALDVESAWTERFTAAVGAVAAARAARSAGWVGGNTSSIKSFASLGSSLGSSFSRQIASSTQAPGSRSGGGGGGSSGGGGGGGGGGGR